jgi:hypothetical protein
MHTGPSASAPSMVPAPHVLRDYALLADGERGAVVGPDGEITWLAAPRWESGAVFSSLIGGHGQYTLAPEDTWRVSGGSYEEGTLVHVARWVTADGIVECREALALPADRRRLGGRRGRAHAAVPRRAPRLRP